MRDPFDAPVDLVNTDHNGGNQLSRTSVVPARDYSLQNGDAKSFAPNSDTLIRHQLQGASLQKDLVVEDPSTRLMDPETKELYLRSQSQEDEILLLRKQVADASLKELRLLNEKHILERRLTDLRMAVDEKQEEAISGAMKQLNQKKNHIEENMRLANDLKAEEEELYLFTSSLLSMLSEYNVRPPQINASTITTGTKRLYQQLYWKIKSLNDSLGDMTQPGNIYNPNHQQATPSRNEPSSSYNMDANRNTLRYAQGSSDRHEQMDIVGTTTSNYFEENVRDGEARVDDDTRLYRHESQDYPADGDPLPGIEGFQIVGEPRLGSTLRACGFPTNGTTLGNFQWVRHLENGTRQSIEGATMYDYVVTADDVGTLLAVDCTPMDDNGREGDLVIRFANDGHKITYDPEMQNHIDACISNGSADFDVLDAIRNTLRYAEGSSDGHVEPRDILGTTTSNYFEENVCNGETRVYGDSQLSRHENQDYSADGDPLPGIEDFQIAGEPTLGSTLTACGFPTNGTTSCNFQWVRHLENGTRQYIVGATMYDYVVTADDVGTLLAVDCTPLNDNDRQGDLVTEFANNGNKITCDPEMQNRIDAWIWKRSAEFEVYALARDANSPEERELATLVLKRFRYQIMFKHTGEVITDEYSPNLQIKIPNGRTTEFVLVTSTGTNIPFNTEGLSKPNNQDYDVRLRDLIVLVMRAFQKKALLSPFQNKCTSHFSRSQSF